MKIPGIWYVRILFLFLLAAGISSCSSSEFLTDGSTSPIRRQWKELNLASRYHVGLSIYDVEKGKSIFGYKDDNYFTPASNAKILTLYTALQLLADTLAAGYVKVQGDTMILWGGGDPWTGYPDKNASYALIDFLRTADKKIVFSNHHFQTTRYGPGWAWDDFPYAYQCERNAYPIYGNQVWIERTNDDFTVTPGYLKPSITFIRDTVSALTRSEWGESYTYRYDHRRQNEVVHGPVAYLKNDMAISWSEATGQEIRFLDVPFDTTASTIPGSARDTLLRIMMHESDNLIAEQLLLASSMAKFGTMDDSLITEQMRHTYFSHLDDYIQWVDGSGLSRYNLVTPRTLVRVLDMIRELKGMEFIKTIFPAGGHSGNIKDWYSKGADHPYVYAKTGSMQNNVCLSGYLMTRKGKILIFSFMHNQHVEDSSTIKSAMEKLFYFLYREY